MEAKKETTKVEEIFYFQNDTEFPSRIWKLTFSFSQFDFQS